MKYIIEIEDTPIQVKDSHTLDAYDVYKAKGFRSLVFDMNGLQKLERYEQQSAYQKGYEAGLAEGRKQAEKDDEKDDEIRVGDEIIAPFSDDYGKAVVTRVKAEQDGNIAMYYVYPTGHIGWDYEENVKKTGRHFDEMEKLLEVMRQ